VTSARPSDERTSIERLADAFDSVTYRVLRDVEASAKTYPVESGELSKAAESLREARRIFRKLMHAEDVRTTE
jgi:hypothetical protein